MKVLVTDAFCSANRGDAAILEGLLSGLRARLPDASVEVATNFPLVARHFHGVNTVDACDPVAVAMAIARADLVVSTGGSFLHERYALNLHPRLATLHLCRRLGKPVVLFGQSFGPFASALGRTSAREALSDATWIVARDADSAALVAELGVKAPIETGVDTAVTGVPAPMVRWARGPLLGVTARSWHFPDGGSQERYEIAMAEACDAWAQVTSGTVWFLSMCTDFGGYRQDDREAARRIAARMMRPAFVEERDDLGFAEVRAQLASCDFVLGTRMHSLVFANTAGVPGVAVAYEDKHDAWLEQVGLEGHSVPISEPEALGDVLLKAWNVRRQLAARIAARLPDLRARAETQLDGLAAVARGHVPRAPARPRMRRGAGWSEETWRYDVPHRRLRAVADLVLSQGGPRVLDLGSSTGALGRMLGPLFDYTGIDGVEAVALDCPGFRVRTGKVEDPWPVAGHFDTIVASGVLEYLRDLDGTLARVREHLADGGMFVATHVNLAHFARNAGRDGRHPQWLCEARPDDLALAMYEAGLVPVWMGATSAGYGPATGVHPEVPTDHDRDGGGQLGPDRIVRLAHQVIFSCRAGAARPGPRAMAAAMESGDVLGAARMGATLVKRFPWAARAWTDLGAAMAAAGQRDAAVRYVSRAMVLDPGRPDARENAAALGIRAAVDPEGDVLRAPAAKEGWVALAGVLALAGRPHAARMVETMGGVERAA